MYVNLITSCSRQLLLLLLLLKPAAQAEVGKNKIVYKFLSQPQ